MEGLDELYGMIKALPEPKVEMVFKIIKAIKDDVDAFTPSEWVGTSEAADELGVTKATIRNYLIDGKLEGRKLSPKKIVVSLDSVKRMRLAQTRF